MMIQVASALLIQQGNDTTKTDERQCSELTKLKMQLGRCWTNLIRWGLILGKHSRRRSSSGSGEQMFLPNKRVQSLSGRPPAPPVTIAN
jgi:hypothetical protein